MGDIPRAFLELKKSAARAMGHLEAVHRKLAEIIESRDPEVTLKLLKDVTWECEEEQDYSGWRITLDESLKDPEFEEAVREHKQKVVTLKNQGLLDAFIEFDETVKRELPVWMTG